MRELIEDIGSFIAYAILALSMVAILLFVLAFIFQSIKKFAPKQYCVIQFTDGSNAQAVGCDMYRDSTNLECDGTNYSMYAVKSWECK